jgi:predicted flap endonuclease-1-like 5' DNA nuclease
VLAQRPPTPQVSKVFPFKPRERVVTRIERERATRAGGDVPAAESNVVNLRAAKPVVLKPLPKPAVAMAAAAPAMPVAAQAPPPAAMAEPEHPVVAEVASARPKAGLTERLERVTAAPPRGASKGEPRFHLTLDQDVVDGPSIGPKTAERLYPHGIKTVRDLLKADPAVLAVLVDGRGITTEVLTDWQDQARLVCTVPGLRGTHAQLLVGAGYRTADAVADAEADKLCADVLTFAASAAGQRVLRNGDPPDIEKIKGWLEAARSAKAA